jgi:hypothetical protein
LFDHLKGEMAGFTANSPANILSETRRVFQEISKKTRVAVYDEWIPKHKGKYYYRESKKSNMF